MSSPSRGSWRRLKTLCRQLKVTPRVVQKAQNGTDLDTVAYVYVDSDWAGCARTQRSYERRMHSAESSLPRDLEHDSIGSCSMFWRGRVLRCRDGCS